MPLVDFEGNRIDPVEEIQIAMSVTGKAMRYAERSAKENQDAEADREKKHLNSKYQSLARRRRQMEELRKEVTVLRKDEMEARANGDAENAAVLNGKRARKIKELEKITRASFALADEATWFVYDTSLMAMEDDERFRETYLQFLARYNGDSRKRRD